VHAPRSFLHDLGQGGQAISGPLFIIGGNEDKKGPRRILKRIAALVRQSERGGGLGIITTASLEERQAYETYRAVFDALGVHTVEHLPVSTRLKASEETVVNRIRQLSLVFFSGGDQLRITSLLGGTLLHRTLLEEHRRGLAIAGTSAGASMMSDTMIVAGDAETMPTRNTVEMAPGMGFWPGAVIDQHFSQRGRIGRLVSALAQNPGILGVGLDEDTAIEVRLDEARLLVHGSRTVTILDGWEVTETNASESSPGQPLALTSVRLHVLPDGYGFDLTRRLPLSAEDPTWSREDIIRGDFIHPLLSRP